MIDYIFKVLLFQALFLVIYDLLLKRETFFQWNRVYLLITPLVAYLIPLIEMNQVSNTVPEEFMLVLPEVILSPETVIEEQVSWYTSGYDFLAWTLWLGGIIAAVLFFIKLYKVIRLIMSNERIKHEAYYLIFTNELSAFSFFKFIFLHKEMAEEERVQIIEHELVHVRQWHTLDLLVFEMQRIVFWFNPFSYIYQNRIGLLHEYIADAKSIKPAAKGAYFHVLLNTAFGTKNISFINPFFEKTSIKKRIIMFNRARSQNIFKMKYTAVLPLLIGMLLYSSCETESTNKNQFPKNEKRTTILYYGSLDDGILNQVKSKKKSYFDVYVIRSGQPPGSEISYDDLTLEEKQEFDVLIDQPFIKRQEKSIKIFAERDGRKSIMVVFDFKNNNISSELKTFGSSDSIPFAVIDQVPIFPDCEEQVDPKKCTTSYISLHVNKNFNSSISKGLDLEPGAKRVYVQFTIDKVGSITDVRARAPHEQLEEEAIRVVKTLPQMIPGEQKGKEVAVKYTLPITIKIE